VINDYCFALTRLLHGLIQQSYTIFTKSSYPTPGAIIMAKHQKSNKEMKKKALLTPKEKKAAKAAKKDASKGHKGLLD